MDRAIATAGPASSGMRFWSIHMSARLIGRRRLAATVSSGALIAYYAPTSPLPTVAPRSTYEPTARWIPWSAWRQAAVAAQASGCTVRFELTEQTCEALDENLIVSAIADISKIIDRISEIATAGASLVEEKNATRNRAERSACRRGDAARFRQYCGRDRGGRRNRKRRQHRAWLCGRTCWPGAEAQRPGRPLPRRCAYALTPGAALAAVRGPHISSVGRSRLQRVEIAAASKPK
jgi:hypothetical protein